MTNESSVLMDSDAANKAAGRRHGAAGAWLRPDRGVLHHRHRHRLGPGPALGRRAAAAGREDHSGPRLHLHPGRRERDRGLARQPARPPVRQRPPAADLNAQPRAHDAVLRSLGRVRPATSTSTRRHSSSPGPKGRPRSASRSTSETSATRWWSGRPARARACSSPSWPCSSDAMRDPRCSPLISAAASEPQHSPWAATGTISAAR